MYHVSAVPGLLHPSRVGGAAPGARRAAHHQAEKQRTAAARQAGDPGRRGRRGVIACTSGIRLLSSVLGQNTRGLQHEDRGFGAGDHLAVPGLRLLRVLRGVLQDPVRCRPLLRPHQRAAVATHVRLFGTCGLCFHRHFQIDLVSK